MNWTWGKNVCNAPPHFCVWRHLGADQGTCLSLLVLPFVLGLPWKVQASQWRTSDKIVPPLPSLSASRVKPRHVPAPEPPLTASTGLQGALGLTSVQGRTALPCQCSQPGERGRDFLHHRRILLAIPLAERLLRQVALCVTPDKMMPHWIIFGPLAPARSALSRATCPKLAELLMFPKRRKGKRNIQIPHGLQQC